MECNKVKRIIKYTVIAIILSVFGFGCSSDLTESNSLSKEYLVIEGIKDNSIFFEEKNTPYSFSLKSNGTWHIIDIASWLNIDHISGSGNQTIKVTVNSSTFEEPRDTIFRIVADKDNTLERKINVHQSPTVIDLKIIGKRVLSFGEYEGTDSFKIKSNVRWYINAPSWCKSIVPKEGDGKDNSLNVSLTCFATDEYNERRGWIFLTSEDYPLYKDSIEIKQAPVSFIRGSKKDLELDPEGGEKSFTITSNILWTIEGDASWFETTEEPSGTTNEGAVITGVKLSFKPNKTGSPRHMKMVIVPNNSDMLNISWPININQDNIK